MAGARAVAAALLFLATALGGCLGGGDLGPTDAGEDLALVAARDTPASFADGTRVPYGPTALPAGLVMPDAEVVERHATNLTLQWSGSLTGTANVLAAGPTTETTLTLPAGVDLSLSITNAVEGPGEIRMWLRDAEGEVICAGDGESGPTETAIHTLTMAGIDDASYRCERDRIPASDDPRVWTIGQELVAGRGEAVSFTTTVSIEAFPSAGPHIISDIAPLEVEAPDGILLRGHAYLPAGPGPHPTILVYSPYFRDSTGLGTDEYAWTLDGDLVWNGYDGLAVAIETGYAIAMVSLRGTGESGGCFSYMDHDVNGHDTNAVIDAIAAEPWSNGHVGMYGISYMAAVQYDAVAFGPSPHLKAAVAVSGEWDEWNMLGNSFGAASLSSLFHAGYRNRQQGLGVTLPGYGAGLSAYVAGPHANNAEHWCERTLEPEVAHYELIVDGDKKGWFEDNDIGDELTGKNVPFFATFGTDEGHTGQINGLWDVLPRPTRFMVGPWDHTAPTDDWDWFARTQAMPWFDHFMRGGPAVPTEQVDYQDQDGTWRVADTWPPRGDDVVLRFSADGRLVDDAADVAAGVATLINDDRGSAVPHACPDVVAFASPPLAEPVTIAGHHSLEAVFSSTAPNANLATLLAYGPGVSDTCGDGAFVEVQGGYSDLRHRGHLEIGSDFPIGTPDLVTLESFGFAVTIPAGECILFAVTAGHPNYVPEGYPAELTLHMDPEGPGAVSFTVVEGTLRWAD